MVKSRLPHIRSDGFGQRENPVYLSALAQDILVLITSIVRWVGLLTLMYRTALSTMTITAQDLYNFTKCAHRVYLDAHGDPGNVPRSACLYACCGRWAYRPSVHLAGFAGAPYTGTPKVLAIMIIRHGQAKSAANFYSHR